MSTFSQDAETWTPSLDPLPLVVVLEQIGLTPRSPVYPRIAIDLHTDPTYPMAGNAALVIVWIGRQRCPTNRNAAGRFGCRWSLPSSKHGRLRRDGGRWGCGLSRDGALQRIELSGQHRYLVRQAFEFCFLGRNILPDKRLHSRIFPFFV